MARVRSFFTGQMLFLSANQQYQSIDGIPIKTNINCKGRYVIGFLQGI